MNAQMQFTQFTHGKCPCCGYLGMIGNFQEVKKNYQKKFQEDGVGYAEIYTLVLICPMCGDEHCEALFPNDVN